LTHASASNTLSCQRETSRSKNPIDRNHGIYRDPAPRAFFRPGRHISVAAARSEGQGRRFFSAAEGSSLTLASTAANCRDRGVARDDPRGACHWSRAIAANHACIRLDPIGPTMKQSYASAGKAPRRRVHSPSGIPTIAVCGLPPPRIIIGYRATSASGAELFFVLSPSTLLHPPRVATQRRLVSPRS
jgi:hypothetical protein